MVTTVRTEGRPHVVHVIDELPPDGAERLLVDVLKCRSAGFRFTVVCLVRGGELERELRDVGVPVVVLGRRGKFDPVMLWRLVAWLRRERAAIVHTHLFTADSWGRVAARLAGVPGIFSTVHSTNQWKGPVHRFVDRVLAPISTKVIACSEEVGQVLKAPGGVRPDRVVVIPNGIDLGRFASATGAGVREEFGVDTDRCLIGVVGRLHPAKGHADMLLALKALRRAGLRFHCLFIGSGELRDALARQVEDDDLTGDVTFAGQRSDVPRLLAALDVLAMPSHWEGLPMALLEGMAMGKAIVASAVGGIPDVIRDGVDGLLVPARDVQALQAALERLIRDADVRDRLGRSARDAALARYDVSRTAADYEALYREALPRGTSPVPSKRATP